MGDKCNFDILRKQNKTRIKCPVFHEKSISNASVRTQNFNHAQCMCTETDNQGGITVSRQHPHLLILLCKHSFLHEKESAVAR
jgi:hypothetical protein